MSITIISKTKENNLKEKRGFISYREFEGLESGAERYIRENLKIIL